jgi:SAM-dependent methyltransferase
MVDRVFSEPRLAALYDVMCAGRPEFPGFYIPLVMAAPSVLDIGCGTGELLKTAREGGHRGRLCGVDPAEAMLDVARARADVEWLLGDAATLLFEAEFDLAVMTGNAFQVLVTDEQITAALVAVRRALTPGGRFAFETRNPAGRQWEQWGTSQVEHDGSIIEARDAGVEVDGDLLRFSTSFHCSDWPEAEVSYSTLRLLEAAALRRFLGEAGLEIEAQYGDWNGEPVTDASLEIVPIARRPAESPPSDSGRHKGEEPRISSC